MFIEFDHDFQSFDEGNNKPFLKENEPFEVSSAEAERLLELTGTVLNEKKKPTKVSIFRKLKVTESQLPEDFPFRKELEKNKIFGFEQLLPMSLQEVLDLDEIGDKKAEAIMAAIQKHKEAQ